MAGVLDDAEIDRILVITAHPDDVDFGAAGTVARWTDAGLEVTYCVVTDGDAGGQDDDFPRAEVPALRRAEQGAAAKCVGVHDVRFLGYPDGRVEATLALRRDLARVIRQVRPDRVVCPSPERNYSGSVLSLLGSTTYCWSLLERPGRVGKRLAPPLPRTLQRPPGSRLSRLDNYGETSAFPDGARSDDLWRGIDMADDVLPVGSTQRLMATDTVCARTKLATSISSMASSTMGVPG